MQFVYEKIPKNMQKAHLKVPKNMQFSYQAIEIVLFYGKNLFSEEFTQRDLSSK